MNLTRLMALGILARSGPSHGHHIRRVADVTNVGEWGGVSVGALYRELRAMEREGLVEAARTEKVGNRPERTVYAITAEGRLELTTLREQAIRPLASGPDPLGVALLFAADGMEPRGAAPDPAGAAGDAGDQGGGGRGRPGAADRQGATSTCSRRRSCGAAIAARRGGDPLARRARRGAAAAASDEQAAANRAARAALHAAAAPFEAAARAGRRPAQAKA